MSVRVLVVDDEESLVSLIRGYLEREGFQVTAARDGPSALELASQFHPDLVVLDLMLPGLDGTEVCRQLRRWSDAYVMMLTARAEEVDKLVGLAVGADDYMTKPFSPRELVARAKAMLRRPRGGISAQGGPESSPPQRIGDLSIDHGRRQVRVGQNIIPVTALEFRLLAALASGPGLVFTREQLLTAAWGPDYFGDDHVVDVHVANLRKKLEPDPAQPRYLETVRGVGYRLKDEFP